MDKEKRLIRFNKGKLKNDNEKHVYRILGKYFNEPSFSDYRALENLYHFFWKWVYKIKAIPFTLKYFLQRLAKGYDDLDKWNIAWYISRKAAPILKEWRNGKMHGSALIRHREDRFGNIIELKDDEIYVKDCNEPRAFEMNEWQAILDDIIFAFQWQIDFDSLDGTVSDNEFKKGNKRQKRGLKLFSIYFNSLWD